MSGEQLYVVRLFDGMDGEWMDITKPVSKEEAQRVWDERTDNGKRAAKYGDIDYYKIFPADTTMRFSEGRSMHR